MKSHSRATEMPARRTTLVATKLQLRVRTRFHLRLHGQLLELDYLRVPAREWADHRESSDPEWHIIEDMGDFIVACRLIG